MSDEIAAIGQHYAPFAMGMMIGCFLFGITISQTIVYFQRYKHDKLFIRGLVWASLIMDGLHFAVVSEAVHFWYIYCKIPQNYAFLPQFHWSLGLSIIATYIITSMVQSLYIMRVYLLSRKWWLTILLSTLSIVQLAFGMVLWADLHLKNELAAVHNRTGQIGGSIELAATSLCDIAISISLWYYLHRGRSGFARTEKVIDKLILYMVNLGLLTSCASALTLVLWLALPNNFVFVTFTLIRSKLYVNSMLVTLNYRKAAQATLAGNAATTTSRFFQEIDVIPLENRTTFAG